jgi:hypothetical protein
MARPRKPAHEVRNRWDALYATNAERAEVTGAAERAGQSVSQYLLSTHRAAPRHGSHDTARVTQALVIAEHLLAHLAREIQQHFNPIDAIVLQANLLAIERSFRHAAMPWSLVLDVDGSADGGAPCC